MRLQCLAGPSRELAVADVSSRGVKNRIGYLVTYRLLGTRDRILLDTVAGSAIIIWQKIEPLVLEARLVENSTLFQDYERMLPRCRECYVYSETSQSAVDANGLGEESLL